MNKIFWTVFVFSFATIAAAPSQEAKNQGKGAFTYNVRCFAGIFDLPTLIRYFTTYLSLFSRIRWSLTYLPSTYLRI